MAKDQEKMNNLLTYLLVGLIVVGAYFIGVYKTRSDMLSKGLGSDSGSGDSVAAQGAQPEEVTELSEDDWNKILSNPVAVEGDENAPVTIVEFTDYQCPFCSRYYSDTAPSIMSDYIETGKVRHVVRDFPLSFHANAEDAAVAARCAGKEGKYFEMADMLFTNQTDWESLADAKETFAGYGDQLGINIRLCQDDENLAQAVQDDAVLGQSVGVSGTPTFFINGKALVGAVPYAQFQTMIDEELGN